MKIKIFMLILLSATSSLAADPLGIKSLYPPLIPFINPIPRAGALEEPGVWQFSLTASYANTFHWDYGWEVETAIILMDMETWSLTPALTLGLTPWLEGTAEFSLTGNYGGVLDPVIEGFHALFNFPNGGRHYAGQNLFNLVLGDSSLGGVWVNNTTRGISLNELLLRGGIQLYENPTGNRRVTLEPMIKIPGTGESFYNTNGKVDWGLRTLLDFGYPGLNLYINLGIYFPGKPDPIPEKLFFPCFLGATTALEWKLSALTLYLQIDGRTSPYLMAHRWLKLPSLVLSPGIGWKTSGGREWQVAFTEELVGFATTDILFTLSMKQTVKRNAS